MNLRDLAPPDDLPAVDARVPGLAVRVGVGVLGVLLTVLVYGASGWIAVGVIMSLIAALVPLYLVGWLLMLFLALGELGDQASLHWQLLLLIAGVHLLHVLALLSIELPWRSWVQPAVFRAPLVRFVAIQIPAQLIAVAALLLLAPNAQGQRPLTLAGFGVIGAFALAGVAVLLLGGAGVGDRDSASEPHEPR